jgi:hypothetical protein
MHIRLTTEVPAHVCNSNTREAEAGRLRIEGSMGYIVRLLSQKNKNQNKQTKTK